MQRRPDSRGPNLAQHQGVDEERAQDIQVPQVHPLRAKAHQDLQEGGTLLNQDHPRHHDDLHHDSIDHR